MAENTQQTNLNSKKT